MGGAKGSVARIVAFPLESEGQLLGDLVANTVDRFRSRSGFVWRYAPALAASALRERSRNGRGGEAGCPATGRWLDCIAEPLLLLDDAGKSRRQAVAP